MQILRQGRTSSVTITTLRCQSRTPTCQFLLQHPAFYSNESSRIIRRTCQLFEENKDAFLEYGQKLAVRICDCALNEQAAAKRSAQHMVLEIVAESRQQSALMAQLVERRQIPSFSKGPSALNI